MTQEVYMIYELALIAQHGLDEKNLTAINDLVADVSKSFEGEVLIADDWGSRELAQPTKSGIERGHYLYFIYQGNNECNSELNRRLGINESIVKFFVTKLGEDGQAGAIVKKFKTPYSKKYSGSVTDDFEDNEGGDRKKFARRRGCWFSAKKIKADWKDPATYSWLINEFGKISPARVSGISRKHQRFAESAIKRARQIGIVSNISNRFAD